MKNEAQRLINKARETLGVLYASDGSVLSKKDILPMARMIATDAISFLEAESRTKNVLQIDGAYYQALKDALDECF